VAAEVGMFETLRAGAVLDESVEGVLAPPTVQNWYVVQLVRTGEDATQTGHLGIVVSSEMHCG
jgi:hypothetical protein